MSKYTLATAAAILGLAALPKTTVAAQVERSPATAVVGEEASKAV